jgi:alpha-L-rhamnosidase
LSVTVPVNTTAQVRVPSDRPDQVTESGLSLDSAAGVESVTYEDAESVTVVIVGSGTYTFEVDRT